MWYLWVLLVIFVLLLICFGVGFVIWKMAVPTQKPEKYRNLPTTDPIEIEIREFVEKVENSLNEMNMEEITIDSYDGLKLHGYFREAESKTNKTIISVHGYHGTAFNTAPIFSHFLVDFNYNILFIDLRSYGKSEGKYTGYGVQDSKDLMSWINYLTDRYNSDIEIALFGISMGGNTVSVLADKVPKEVKCIIDDCGYTSPQEEFKYLLKEQMHVPVFFLFFANIINKIVCHYGFKDVNSVESLKGSKVPVLFISGDSDTFVPTRMTKENYEACTNTKEIKFFKGVEHARSYFLNKEEYKKLVLDFLAKYL